MAIEIAYIYQPHKDKPPKLDTPGQTNRPKPNSAKNKKVLIYQQIQ
jgi:hypothetical protein